MSQMAYLQNSTWQDTMNNFIKCSGDSQLYEQNLSIMRNWFCMYYDDIVQISNTTDSQKIGFLSDLATVFACTQYVGEYNKVCYLIRQELKKR